MLLSSVLLASSLLGACATDTDDGDYDMQPSSESEPGVGDGKEDSPAPGPEVPVAQQSKDIGQFFMVDHYGVTSAGYPAMKKYIRENNLGSIILWNPTGATGEVVRQMVSTYSAYAAQYNRDELFYSADQEELHTQRFKSAQGFTNLTSGNVLGDSIAKHGTDRMCELQARITSREMASVGLNMALGTVSDIYVSDSGTRGMFATRAIDNDPTVVAGCVTAMEQGYGAEGHVVYITKHFPGLGNASGNTDVSTNVHTRSTTKVAMERELSPYRQASADVNATGKWKTFGAMISHASYPVIDGGANPATLSPTILSDFMRGPTDEVPFGGKDNANHATSFAGMNFQGLLVSDAFWTWGAVKGITTIQKQRLMARSFLAGMDILMISNTDFTGAWGYFQEIYANLLPAAERTALMQATGYTSWDALRTDFMARITESAARIRAVKAQIGKATASMGTGPANRASTALVSEYQTLSH
jgi:beta-glucosidase-like glycosyl hydrolase